MRVGVTGASGMLGSKILSKLSGRHKLYATSRTQGIVAKNISWECFDLMDLGLLRNWLHNTKPDIVIHCAAFVNIDFCEENFDLAYRLHVDTTSVISDYLNSSGGRLIYISTDSVYDGEKIGSYVESDPVRPLNNYSKTKLLGEKPVGLIENGLILRTNIIGENQGERNSFAEWIFEALANNEQLNLFEDVLFSPIHVSDLAKVIDKIIREPIFGLFHCASVNHTSKFDFGIEMAKEFNFSCQNINKVSIDASGLKTARPKNMSLDVSKLSNALNYQLPGFRDAIKSMNLNRKSIK